MTDAKIAGPISGSKISSTGFDADTLDGKHAAGLEKKYAQVVVVAVGGGDFTDLVAAVNSITDASANKPYLVKVMPGVYNIGSQSVVMRPFVDLEGSGVNVTRITKFFDNYSPLIQGAVNARISNLTLESTFVVALSQPWLVDNVDIAGGGPLGIQANAVDAIVRNVSINATYPIEASGGG